MFGKFNENELKAGVIRKHLRKNMSTLRPESIKKPKNDVKKDTTSQYKLETINSTFHNNKLKIKVKVVKN